MIRARDSPETSDCRLRPRVPVMNHAGDVGPDFQLPDEILSVIPTDPYDQLDLARRITGMAIASRVSNLESEAGRMRRTIAEKDSVIAELQDRLTRLELAVQESDARLRTTLEDNNKLSKEREMLTMTTKKLSRDLVKLETFKRHLMQSLNEDNPSHQIEGVNLAGHDQSSTTSPPRRAMGEDEPSMSRIAKNVVGGSSEVGDYNQDERLFEPKLSSTPYITPRLTPTATPKGSSTGGTPRGFATAGSSPKFLSGTTSPKFLSGTTSPIKGRFEGHSIPSWYSSSQQPSAPASPPQGRSLSGRSRIDGKEFFRQARSRLSYEQFGSFLANIKELNAKRQSREETLEKAGEIFGTENKDLFLSFQGLLNRNLC